MAFSLDKKMIFIHIPKNAGTSIIKAFSLSAPGHYSACRPIAAIQPYMDKVDFFKFCVVRNPWDRLVSSYEYAKMPESYYHGEHNPHPDFELVRTLSFSSVIQILLNFPHVLKHDCWLPQADWVTDLNDTLLMDQVIKMETLNDDVVPICAKFSVKELPKLNTSIREDYKTYYTDALIADVGKVYARDCVFFGYTFHA